MHWKKTQVWGMTALTAASLLLGKAFPKQQIGTARFDASIMAGIYLE